jgi:hypothetical protein
MLTPTLPDNSMRLLQGGEIFVQFLRTALKLTLNSKDVDEGLSVSLLSESCYCKLMVEDLSKQHLQLKQRSKIASRILESICGVQKKHTSTGNMTIICPVSSKVITMMETVCVTDPQNAAAPETRWQNTI